MLKARRDTPPAEHPASTAHYVDEMAAAGRPITLRIDDRPPLVIEDERTRKLLWQLLDRIETLAALQSASQQMARSEGIPFDEAMARLRQRFGIPKG
jgi:hypothetical protein